LKEISVEAEEVKTPAPEFFERVLPVGHGGSREAMVLDKLSHDVAVRKTVRVGIVRVVQEDECVARENPETRITQSVLEGAREMRVGEPLGPRIDELVAQGGVQSTPDKRVPVGVKDEGSASRP
jgi:hypothetical protein